MEIPKKSGTICAVRNCKNRQLKCKYSFFRFPKDIVRARIWLIASHREDLLDKLDQLFNSHRICGAHFESKMFLNDLHNRLQPYAVPTIMPSVECCSRYDHTYSAYASFQTFPTKSTEVTIENEEPLQKQIRVIENIVLEPKITGISSRLAKYTSPTIPTQISVRKETYAIAEEIYETKDHTYAKCWCQELCQNKRAPSTHSCRTSSSSEELQAFVEYCKEYIRSHYSP